jgi:DNA replication protein DnaC
METDLLIKAYLKKLRMPTMAREFVKLAEEAARTNLPYDRYLMTLLEQEVLQREENTLKLRIKRAGFPVLKTFETYDFTAMPSLSKQEVLQLAKGEWIREGANVVAAGNPGTGKTHVAIALAIAACREGYRVRFFTASSLVMALSEALAEHRLSKVQKKLDRTHLIVVDEVGYVPLPKDGPQLLFDFFARRYERRSVLVTTNLEFSRWPEVFGGDEMMTGAMLDRLTHHCTILHLNGESYRFRQSQKEQQKVRGTKSARTKETEPTTTSSSTKKKVVAR